jgi:protein phosphatase
VEKGNTKIFHHAMDDMEKRGMGTTLTLSIIRNNQLKIAQVGDSRAYLIRKKSIRLLTKDHSLVQNEVDLGLITPEEALWDPRKNIITKAVGIIAKVEPDFYDYTLELKDRILLCSDGLYDLVPEKELLQLSQKKSLEECVHHLINKANAHGGKDNVTVVMAEINHSNGIKKQIKNYQRFWSFKKHKKEEKA